MTRNAEQKTREEKKNERRGERGTGAILKLSLRCITRSLINLINHSMHGRSALLSIHPIQIKQRPAPGRGS